MPLSPSSSIRFRSSPDAMHPPAQEVQPHALAEGLEPPERIRSAIPATPPFSSASTFARRRLCRSAPMKRAARNDSYQVQGQLEADDAPAKADDVHVVVLHPLMGGEVDR